MRRYQERSEVEELGRIQVLAFAVWGVMAALPIVGCVWAVVWGLRQTLAWLGDTSP